MQLYETQRVRVSFDSCVSGCECWAMRKIINTWPGNFLKDSQYLLGSLKMKEYLYAAFNKGKIGRCGCEGTWSTLKSWELFSGFVVEGGHSV